MGFVGIGLYGWKTLNAENNSSWDNTNNNKKLLYGRLLKLVVEPMATQLLSP